MLAPELQARVERIRERFRKDKPMKIKLKYNFLQTKGGITFAILDREVRKELLLLFPKLSAQVRYVIEIGKRAV